MRTLIFNTITLLMLLGFSSCKNTPAVPVKATSTDLPSAFNEDIREKYFIALDSTAYYVSQIDTLASLEKNQSNFLESHKWYKKLEPMLIAYDYENYLSMNAPNLLKVEIDDYTDIKKLKPKSFQVLEEILFGDAEIHNADLQDVIYYLQVRIPYIRRNHIIYDQRDRHHLKMIRDAIVNIATKGITGFDSPMLSNSLQDAIYSYETLSDIIDIYKDAFSDGALYLQWKSELKAVINNLNEGDFDSFDRYYFIRKHTNHQLTLVNKTATDWGTPLNTSRSLNPEAENIFDKDFFNLSMFSMPGSSVASEERIALGKALFNDESLSSTGSISCATCHIKEKAFTDGHPKALGSNGRPLLRNTPTLSYAAYQKTFFYDGSGDELEGQIVSVVNNENEFHLDLNTMESRVRENPEYVAQFNALYDGNMSNINVRNAIADYIRSLAPFDSRFDRNMQGLEATLTEEEIAGFNLFMGKAACATCHFPPAFNGTVPPKYMESEFENLGVPENSNFEHPVLDKDLGQYYPYEVNEKRGFFKTSSVRNVALTAPYMHNGVYETLDEVITFYNVGGGQGMGLDVPYQTLPPDSLHLNPVESKALIAFLQSLTDQEFERD